MLFTYTTGQPTAPAIVFLHGAGLSGRMWQPQMERLPDYYCLAPDLPEQGKSLSEGPFRLNDAARQVIELIRERIPTKRAHLVGLSLGGAVTLTIMQLAPEYIDHAIVSGTAARLGKILGTIGQSTGVLFKFMKPEPLVDASIKSFGIPEQYHDMFREDMLLTSYAAFYEHIFKSLMSMQLPCDSSVPTLVAVGERETIPAKQAAKKLVTCLKRSQGVIAPGVSHVWNLQAPDLFTEMVRAWIEDCPLPGALRPLMKQHIVRCNFLSF
jgi:pimeloyl-ACP methyl ester carboxylesterase